MILALDLSLTATGWATSVDEYGVYRPDSKGTERLIDLADWLMRLCDGYQSDFAVVEGYSFGSRGRSVFDIAEWGGVARYLLADFEIPFVEVPPAVLKKFATGKGTSPKPTMRMELYKRTDGLDVADDNAVDALWLLAAAHQATGDPLWPMPKVNVEALGKVEWP